MVKIGLIGTQSMHSLAFAQVCNVPDKKGNYSFPHTRVTAVYGVDDNQEHIRKTCERGKVPICCDSLEKMYEHCNAFMILQRHGGEHMQYATELISKGYPVFIDKPICNTFEDINVLKELTKKYDAVIYGGSGLKNNGQVRALKDQIRNNCFGEIKEATITYSADIDSPYDGIFFYLPHAVEIMLELFGYDPKTVRTTVCAHDEFIIYIEYERFLINLNMNKSKQCVILMRGQTDLEIEIDSSDIFVETIRHFLSMVERREICKDVDRLTKGIEVILAVKEAMKSGKEVEIKMCTYGDITY